MWSSLLISMLVPGAFAVDCDVSALKAKVRDASPVSVAEAFVALEACDADAAKEMAGNAVPRIVPAREAADAMVASIRVGEPAAVRSWLAAQEPDARSRTIARIGKACAGTPAIGDFFADAAEELGATFWEERWHRGLADCRYERVQGLLAEAIQGPTVGRDSRNRGGFFALLEVYARNTRVQAVPTVAELLANARDEEESVFLVSIFADAANVGGSDGVDAAAQAAAVAAIQDAAPSLPYRALDRARGTLISLGADAAASGLAKHGWADAYVDGQYTYAVSAIEDITCRNGSKRAVLHLGSVVEPGAQWPDELAAVIEGTVSAAWTLEGASRCKGTSVVQVQLSSTPLDAAGLDAWTTTTREAFAEKFGAAKTSEVQEQALTL